MVVVLYLIQVLIRPKRFTIYGQLALLAPGCGDWRFR
jgi:hypothetical protein